MTPAGIVRTDVMTAIDNREVVSAVISAFGYGFSLFTCIWLLKDTST